MLTKRSQPDNIYFVLKICFDLTSAFQTDSKLIFKEVENNPQRLQKIFKTYLKRFFTSQRVFFVFCTLYTITLKSVFFIFSSSFCVREFCCARSLFLSVMAMLNAKYLSKKDKTERQTEKDRKTDRQRTGPVERRKRQGRERYSSRATTKSIASNRQTAEAISRKAFLLSVLWCQLFN